MYYAVLEGTSHGRLNVSFKSSLDLETGTRIVKEFGFNLTPIDKNAKLQDAKHFPYSQDFRVFCSSEKYKE